MQPDVGLDERGCGALVDAEHMSRKVGLQREHAPANAAPAVVVCLYWCLDHLVPRHSCIGMACFSFSISLAKTTSRPWLRGFQNCGNFSS